MELRHQRHLLPRRAGRAVDDVDERAPPRQPADRARAGATQPGGGIPLRDLHPDHPVAARPAVRHGDLQHELPDAPAAAGA